MKRMNKFLALCLAGTLTFSMTGINAIAANGDVGTQSNPITVVEAQYIPGYYFMSDALEAGDKDGLWYELDVDTNAVFCLEVNCSADVKYTVTAMVLDKNGKERVSADNSEGNPIILGKVTKGETI